MHGVMGNDEQAGVQESSEQNKRRCDQRWRPAQIEIEGVRQGQQPGDPDQNRQLQSPVIDAEDVNSHPA